MEKERGRQKKMICGFSFLPGTLISSRELIECSELARAGMEVLYTTQTAFVTFVLGCHVRYLARRKRERESVGNAMLYLAAALAVGEYKAAHETVRLG